MSSQQLNVAQFLLYETGTYEHQYRRPITTNVYSDNLARVQEATSFGANLSANALSRVASEILMPCTKIEGGAIVIPNGWQTKRYHFIMEIITSTTSHGNYRKILTGYTDYADISHGGHLPPDMCLIINSHISLRDVAEPGPHGIQYRSTIINNDQILLGNYNRMGSVGNDHSLRPYDVLLRMGTTRMLSEEDNTGMVNFDLTSTFSSGVKNNARKNTNPGTYMSKLLTACRDAVDNRENTYLDDHTAIIDSAAGALAEGLMSDDIVFSKFNRITDFANTGYITIRQLEEMCPGAESRSTVHRHGGVHATKPPHQVGQASHWTGENLETIFATQIAQALPGILLDNAVNRMSLVMTNMNVDGSYTVMPVEHTVGSVIQGLDLIRMAERIKQRVLNELMPGLTKNNTIGIYIVVDCDTLADTAIKVSIEGRPYEEFVSPTFADALIAPVMTNNLKLVERIVHDVDNLSNNIGVSSAMRSPEPRIYTGATTPNAGFGGRFR